MVNQRRCPAGWLGRGPKPDVGGELVRAAVHEAGHVVGEYALGRRIRSARLDHPGGGYTRLPRRAWRPTDEALLAALAGPAAEALWRGAAVDAVLSGPGCEHDRSAVADWLEPGEQPADYERLAVALLDRNWAAVSSVAAALVVRRRITHRQVMGLLLTARRRERAAGARVAPPELSSTRSEGSALELAA